MGQTKPQFEQLLAAVRAAEPILTALSNIVSSDLASPQDLIDKLETASATLGDFSEGLSEAGDVLHSPGPWSVVDDEVEYGGFFINTEAADGSAGAITIFGREDEEIPALYAQNLANARLIAAAPELFSALRLLLVHADRAHPVKREILNLAEAAIAKARGQ